ncbi:FabD/lysophospholipase-like protein [Mycena venus]|uniref:FabD/lysophospholipase-like protein n=1 Tax=Mycena venus TaxID=2733690 RepID=A0A8H6X939_9AGAR|nr:FabD/lysophospholipase-like protein [Mycena venus]
MAHAAPYFGPASLSTSSKVQTTSILVPQVNQTINNCPLPSRIFHGRQNILDKMHGYFTQKGAHQHIFLLHGVGGAGKTQIALKFIHASSCFSDSFYIDASTRDTINAGLKNIALIKAGNTSEDALNWLQGKHNQWLLFFDNADDPEIDLNQFFPQCDHGNIIITSRNPGLRFYAGFDARISDMEETDAVKLLLIRAAQEVTPGNEEIAAMIVQELSCLPLAIIQAGAFIAESGALNTYLGLYKQNRDRLLSKKPAQAHDNYGRTVYTTWQISFNRLSELAQTFLQLCSFLHYQGISENIFSKASVYKFPANGPSEEELQKPLEFLSQYLGPTGDWDSLRFREVTTELQAYSLIDFNPETSLFSIHPLVHSWSQITLTDLEMYHNSMVAIMGMSIATILDEDVHLTQQITTIRDEDVQLALQLTPHIDSLRRGQTQVKPDFNAQYASTYFHSGKMKEAAELEALVLEKRRATLGEDHPDTLQSMRNLGVTYSELGQWKKVKELAHAVLTTHGDLTEGMILDSIKDELEKLDKAVGLRSLVLQRLSETVGEDHPDTLRAKENLATTYRKMGQWNKAEELLVVLLEKRRETLREDHPDILSAMGSLAVVYYQLGHWNKAEKLQAPVLEKQRETPREDHPDTLTAMEILAVTYSQMGQWSTAEELEVGMFKKQSETLGGDHPDTLTAMEMLAVICRNLGQWNEVEMFQAVILLKHIETLGEDHPNTLEAVVNLAQTYRALRGLDEVKTLQVLVLEKQREILGNDHLDTLTTMADLALTYYKLGQWNKAEELLVVLLEKHRETLGEDHPNILSAMGSLAVVYYQQGQWSKAEKLQVLVLEKQRQTLGVHHPDTVTAMRDLALIYHKMDPWKSWKLRFLRKLLGRTI